MQVMWVMKQLKLSGVFVICLLMKRRNLLRIRGPRQQRMPTEHISTSFTISEPAADQAKAYLATLQDEELDRDGLSHSLAFDLTLAEWKSRAELTESVPVEAHHRRKQMLLYAQEQDTIPVITLDSSSALQASIALPESIILPTVASATEISALKERSRKPFFNFQSNATEKARASNRTNKKEREAGQCVKPALFTLSQDVTPPRDIGPRQIKLNFPNPKYSEGKATLLGGKACEWPLHGIHQCKNKFQLILNSRKQRTTRMIRISIKQDPAITIYARKIQ